MEDGNAITLTELQALWAELDAEMDMESWSESDAALWAAEIAETERLIDAQLRREAALP